MKAGQQRAASEGPWLSAEDCERFRQWLSGQGIEWRPHPGLGSAGYQVRHEGHWMALLWNKNFRRYTVDRRLAQVARQFEAEQVR